MKGVLKLISISGLEYLKSFAEVEAEIIPGGILYLYIEGDTIKWRKASSSFKLDIFNVDEVIKTNSIAARAMREKKILSEKIPRSLYGSRFTTVAIPLIDEEKKVVGAFSILIPRLHPVIKSFRDFAPIIAEMFPEGATLFVTDLQKIIDKQSSKKFDIPELKIDDSFLEDSMASEVIKTKAHCMEEIDSSKFGVNVLEACYPLFDEENENEVVGNISIITPKEVAVSLRNMSNNLENNLQGIVSAIQQLADSATDIHTNEQELNTEIQDIITLSEEINEISAFIKKIADETKMLGLNAAIEAARAGEAGKGFGVVAQEIRKLSEQSKSTVPKINQITENIKVKVNEVSQRSISSLASSQEQASATEEITASIEEISSATEELNNIAKSL
jgi:hypothetical protein